jgi:hypothetical protein
VNNDLQLVKSALARSGIMLALTLFSVAMVFVDIFIAKTDILETSFTEVSQEVMLALIAGLFWLSAREPGQRGVGILIGGFFACMLIRELDGLFDPISHSFWLWPALLTAGTCLYRALGYRGAWRDVVSGLARFSVRPAFGFIMAGLLALIFSRLFGMGSLWHGILQEGYARLAKTTVEEGVELLAYSICLGGALDYFLELRRDLSRFDDLTELQISSPAKARRRAAAAELETTV